MNDGPMEQDGRDKRAHRRMYRKLIAHFHIRPHDNSERKSWDIVTVRDLSAGGVLFNYDKKLEEGLAVDFKINFPWSEEQIVCGAKVVRVGPSAGYGVFAIAAVFTEISEEDKRGIEEIAAKLHLGEPTGTVLDRDWSKEG